MTRSFDRLGAFATCLTGCLPAIDSVPIGIPLSCGHWNSWNLSSRCEILPRLIGRAPIFPSRRLRGLQWLPRIAD